MKYNIPIILGTAREGRKSEHVAKFLHALTKDHDSFSTELVDVRDFKETKTIPSWEDAGVYEGWREKAEKADGFIIVVPEYNHGYPGELKLLLDSAHKEYLRKPVLVAGVSSGIFGGARVVENLRTVLVEYGMVLLKSAVYTTKVEELFDESGEIVTDRKDEFRKRVEKAFEELEWFVKVLKEGRES